jgi:hypothetical protein
MIVCWSIVALVFILKIVKIVMALFWATRNENYILFKSRLSSVSLLTEETFSRIIKETRHPSFYYRANNPFIKKLLNYFFRYPVLSLGLCLCITLFPVFKLSIPSLLSVTSIVLLFLGVFVETAHMLVYRYYFGSYDNYLYAMSTRKYNFNEDERNFIQNLIIIYGGLWGVVVLSYTFIYYLLPVQFGLINSCGNNIGKGYSDLITYFYFSISTIATVGYGDISAGHIWSQLLVSSEIIVSFILFILLLSAVAKTIGSDRK